MKCPLCEETVLWTVSPDNGDIQTWDRSVGTVQVASLVSPAGQIESPGVRAMISVIRHDCEDPEDPSDEERKDAFWESVRREGLLRSCDACGALKDEPCLDLRFADRGPEHLNTWPHRERWETHMLPSDMMMARREGWL